MRLRELERQLACHGFTLSRIKGSHRVYRTAGGQVLVIAAHNQHQTFTLPQQIKIWRTVLELERAEIERGRGDVPA